MNKIKFLTVSEFRGGMPLVFGYFRVEDALEYIDEFDGVDGCTVTLFDNSNPEWPEEVSPDAFR